MFILTVIITWRLWLTGRPYPHAPLFSWLPQLPPPFDFVMAGILLAALAAMAIMRDPRLPIRIVLAAGLLLALPDQTRWQPYIIHFIVIPGSLLLLPWGRRDRWTNRDVEWGLMPARLLLAFTYLYSGLQKFNYDFFTWLFGWITEPLLDWLDIAPTAVPPMLLVPLAFLAATAETLAGALLLFARWRRPAAIFLIGMHLFILLMIGPAGRGTNVAVWPWNVAMIGTLWLLFVRRRTPADARVPAFPAAAWWRAMRTAQRDGAPSRTGAAATAGTLILFGLLPLLSFADLWDSYPSFSIYSGTLYEARIYVASEDRGMLPPYVVELIDADGGFDPTFWAVHEFTAPPYPEPRVMLALGRELARRATHADVYLQIAGRPDLSTGERRVRIFRCPLGGGEPVEEKLRADSD